MDGFKRDMIAVLGFTVLLLILPQLLRNDYYINTLTLSLTRAIIAVGLNLLMGYTGQVSLGHAAFYGLAAYTSAILTTTYSVPLPLGMAGGILVSGVVALLIGIPTLKLKGNYLAMATLGFGVIVYIFFNETIGLTGGPSGFGGIARLQLMGYRFSSDLSYYYLVAIVLACIVLLSLNLIRSRIGRALRAIHTSETASQIAGIDVANYKVFVFVLSALFAGVAGVLYVHNIAFVAPGSFGFNFSIELVTMVVLGGMANIWGAVIGACFLSILPEFLRVFENIEIVMYGAILIVFTIFLPEGIAGGIGKLFLMMKRKRDDAAGKK
jgi:branched-chain amino acid transport system permease protein